MSERRHHVCFAHCHLQMPKLRPPHLPQDYLADPDNGPGSGDAERRPASCPCWQEGCPGASGWPAPASDGRRPVGQLFPWVPRSLETALTSLQWRVCDLFGVNHRREGWVQGPGRCSGLGTPQVAQALEAVFADPRGAFTLPWCPVCVTTAALMCLARSSFLPEHHACGGGKSCVN